MTRFFPLRLCLSFREWFVLYSIFDLWLWRIRAKRKRRKYGPFWWPWFILGQSYGGDFLGPGGEDWPDFPFKWDGKPHRMPWEKEAEDG